MVAPGPGRSRIHQAAGDLPGQRAEELWAADAVLEADGGVRRLVGSGDPLGVLSAVSQQVQPDRAVLVGAGEEVERRALERLEGGAAMRPADALEEETSDGEATPGYVSRWRTRVCQGDEADRGASAAVGHPAEVRHHDQTENDRTTGKVIVAGRLSGPQAVQLGAQQLQQIISTHHQPAGGAPRHGPAGGAEVLPGPHPKQRRQRWWPNA